MTELGSIARVWPWRRRLLDGSRRAAPQAFRAQQFRAVRAEDYQRAATSLAWVQRAGTSFRRTGSWLGVFTAVDPRGSDRVAVDQLLELTRLLDRPGDCVCEHLLVNCPTGQGKVYLADVSFKDGAIYQICNFHHRKYVRTFPTIDYWLSLVPIIPLLKFAVEKLCCTPIAGFFDEVLERNQTGKTRAAIVSPTMIHNAMTYIQAADLPGSLKTMKSQATLTAGLAKASRSPP